MPRLSSSRRRVAAAVLAFGALPALVAAHRPRSAEAWRSPAVIPSERSESAVIPSERSESPVIPSERSESRDLHLLDGVQLPRLRAARSARNDLPVIPSERSESRDPHLAGIPTGSYVAVLANGQKLPWTTQVPAVKGLAHWARLDLAVLRLNANGRYTLSYRYAQEVVDTKAQLQMPPARDEISAGRYSDKGRTLTFVPTPSPGKTARTVTAQVVGADIYLDKTVFVGERPFRVRLLFRRDPSLW